MKKTILLTIFVLGLFSLFAQQSKSGPIPPEDIDHGIINKTSKAQVVISGVPTYIWQHGCGPTALGMVVGYYDSHGFPDLIQGSAYDVIANSDHYDDYSYPEDSPPNMEQDKSETGGAHTSNCLGDFMKTSWSARGNYYGWSYSSDVDNAFTDYVNLQNSSYTVSTSYNYYNLTNSWDVYVNEINNNRPVVLLVDSDGDGSTDHFVPGIGYDDATNEYACLNTWDHSIHWYTFREMSDSYSWGIYGFNLFQISASASVSENETTFDIYPNPVTEILHIDIPENKNFQAEIYDLCGKLILSENSKEINLKHYDPGVYILKVKTDSYTITKKIIKK